MREGIYGYESEHAHKPKRISSPEIKNSIHLELLSSYFSFEISYETDLEIAEYHTGRNIC